jgi:hypothetical protein
MLSLDRNFRTDPMWSPHLTIDKYQCIAIVETDLISITKSITKSRPIENFGFAGVVLTLWTMPLTRCLSTIGLFWLVRIGMAAIRTNAQNKVTTTILSRNSS